MPVKVFFPLLNPNEPEAKLAAIHVSVGQRVAAGDVLFTLETTKSTEEVTSEADGFIAGLQASLGQTVNAGDVFCYLAEAPGLAVPDWSPPPAQELGSPKTVTPVKSPLPASKSVKASAPDQGAAPAAPLPDGLRITQPALALARQAGLDLSKLPAGPLVTEKMVDEWIGNLGAAASSSGIDNTKIPLLPEIIVYGGGGHGKALIDLLRSLGTYHLVGVVDDGFPVGTDVMGLPVLGGRDALVDLYAQGVRLAINAVGGIGSISVRIKVFQTLAQAGFTCPVVVHPSAWVEPSASLAAGVQVFPHAYVGSQARIGFGSIVNTGAIVSHECVLGECVNISPGAILAGQVQVGDGVLIGMGVTVNLQVNIGAKARVGNSATVKADVPSNGIVRAGAVYP